MKNLGIKSFYKVEVTEKQYLATRETFSGLVAFRKEKNDKYFIKLMDGRFENQLNQFLNNIK